MRIFSVRDSKAKVYIQPIADRNSAQAERNFKTAVTNPETDFHKYPEDFQLFELASWDPDTGIIIPHPSPILVCDAKSLM